LGSQAINPGGAEEEPSHQNNQAKPIEAKTTTIEITSPDVEALIQQHIKAGALKTETPRLSRTLQQLRRWSRDEKEVEKLLTRGKRARDADGMGPRQ